MARQLQASGVFMGKRFAPVVNPQFCREGSTFEDAEFRNFTWFRETGKIDAATWEREIRDVAKARYAMGVPWGFKDPTLALYMQDLVRIFPDATYIWCLRPLENVVASWMRAYAKQIEEMNATPETVIARVLERDDLIGKWIPRPCLEVWIERDTSDECKAEGADSRSKSRVDTCTSRLESLVAG